MASLALGVLLSATRAAAGVWQNRAGEPGGIPEPPPETVVIGDVMIGAGVWGVGPRWAVVRKGLRLQNRGSAPGELEVGGCPLLVRAYRDSSRAGGPAWDEERRPGWACPASLQILRIEPGSDRHLEEELKVSEILGDSLPGGRYFFTVVAELEGARLEISAGDAWLEPWSPSQTEYQNSEGWTAGPGTPPAFGGRAHSAPQLDHLDRLGVEVDSLVVAPRRLALEVGQELNLQQAVRVEARDRTGRVLPRIPLVLVTTSPFVLLDGTRIVGLGPGTAEIRITSAIGRQDRGPPAAEAVLRIVVSGRE